MIIINNMLQSGKTSRKTVPTVSQHHAGACVCLSILPPHSEPCGRAGIDVVAELGGDSCSGD